jgi:wyosine [tRNA(Phe)-imidazoG37] synthetase (radical SAM superfamily)
MKIISRILRPLPQLIYLEPVFGCNYRCFFCVHGGDRGPAAPVQLSPAVFERLKPIIDQAAHIHLTGLGEPFLNAHIVDYLAYFRDKGKKYYINTNGSLIGDAHIELLLTSFSELSVSLDAADRSTYGRMRHPDNWDRIVRTVKRISDLRLNRSSRFPLLYLTFHINRMNLSSLRYLPELCQELRIDAVKLSWTILPEMYQSLSPHEDLHQASGIIRPLVSDLRRKGVGIRDEVLFQPHQRGCWDLTAMTFVGANGAVAACCNRWLPVGDLAVNSFEEIWNGALHRRVFFGALNRRPVADCAGCRQLQIVDYVADPGAFVKHNGADEAVLAQKRRSTGKLPPLGNLEKEFTEGIRVLAGNGKDSGRALDMFESLATRYPDYYEIRNNWAVACFLSGQVEKCRALLAGIRSIPHNRGIVAYNLEYLDRQPVGQG